ncbi:hypothetical protein NNF97_10925, partial [Enterococcus faecium]|nr:hypothetical protein [Enterococcus faecium]
TEGTSFFLFTQNILHSQKSCDKRLVTTFFVHVKRNKYNKKEFVCLVCAFFFSVYATWYRP